MQIPGLLVVRCRPLHLGTLTTWSMNFLAKNLLLHMHTSWVSSSFSRFPKFWIKFVLVRITWITRSTSHSSINPPAMIATYKNFSGPASTPYLQHPRIMLNVSPHQSISLGTLRWDLHLLEWHPSSPVSRLTNCLKREFLCSQLALEGWDGFLFFVSKATQISSAIS